MKTLTPKFDKLVEKYRKAGHRVDVFETQLVDSDVYVMKKEACIDHQFLAASDVYRTSNLESFRRNAKCKI